MSARIAILAGCLLLVSGCCSQELCVGAERFKLAKHHLLIREWEFMCEAPCDVMYYWVGPDVENSFIGGRVDIRGEQLLWLQWDVATNEIIVHQPEVGSSMHTSNEFGGSFRVAEPEGHIENPLGTIRLLESYDRKTAFVMRVKRRDADE